MHPGSKALLDFFYKINDNLCMNCEKGVKFYHVNTLLAALDEDYYINMLD
jgi:hypothetical protein